MSEEKTTNPPAENAAAPTAKPKKVSFKILTEERAIEVAFDGKIERLPLSEELVGVQRHLALMGLAQYLQKAKGDGVDKLAEIKTAYQQLATEGMNVFEKKKRNRTGISKGAKIIALAVLKGTTPAVINAKLAEKTKEEQEKILNSEDVLAKARAMQDSGADIDL